MEKGKNTFSCIALLPFKLMKYPQEYAECAWKIKNLVKIDGFVKSVGFHCTQDYVTQDQTH
jgi:hypothetical protein